MLDWLNRLREGAPLLLDGATGTELERRGLPCDPPLWSTHGLLERPAWVEAIHLEYLDAGAELLTAATFRTQRRALAGAEMAERARELTEVAVSLARAAAFRADRPVAVLGSAPPLADCYHPDLVPEEPVLIREHEEHAANLAAAGVDAVLAETMNTVREAVVAVRAARGVGLPVLVSFVCWEGARLLSGETLELALAALRGEEPAAVLVNCLPIANVAPCLPVLRDSGLPFGVYPNVGAALEPGSRARSAECSPEEFADAALPWLSAGARLVGGCCGTTPAHIRRLAQKLRS